MDRIEQPLNQRSRRTRGAILDAAWKLIEEQGPASVSIAAIAREAGVSRRAIYLHFSSRGDILLALVDHIDEVLDLDASMRPIRDAQTIEALIEASVTHVATYHPKIMRVHLAIDQARHSDADAAALYALVADAWHSGCRDIAELLVRDGRLREPWTVDTAADLLWTLMSSHVLAHLTVERGWSQERFRTLMSDLIKSTLLKPGDAAD